MVLATAKHVQPYMPNKRNNKLEQGLKCKQIVVMGRPVWFREAHTMKLTLTSTSRPPGTQDLITTRNLSGFVFLKPLNSTAQIVKSAGV